MVLVQPSDMFTNDRIQGPKRWFHEDETSDVCRHKHVSVGSCHFPDTCVTVLAHLSSALSNAKAGDKSFLIYKAGL